MDSSAPDLVEQLMLEQIGPSRYRSVLVNEGFQRIYGGLVLAHAVIAVSSGEGSENRRVHSLHGYFLEAGDPEQPIIYETRIIRQGRSFSVCHIDALQDKRRIFQADVSLHVAEESFEHSQPMPSVTDPEQLVPEEEIFLMQAEASGFSGDEIDKRVHRKRHLEVRPVQPLNYFEQEKGEPFMQTWMRTRQPLPDDPRLHQAALAYMSDWLLLDTSLRPHPTEPFSDKLVVVSLDHALWMHSDFRADSWLLFSQDSPVAKNARGFNRGGVFDRSSGKLVASTAQEALVRMLK